MLQAGTSGKGREFAANYGDAVFTVQPHLESANRCTTTSSAAPSRPAVRRQPAGCCWDLADRRRLARRGGRQAGQAQRAGSARGWARHPFGPLRLQPVDPAARHCLAHRTEPTLQRMQTRYRSVTGELLTAGGAEPWPDGRPAVDDGHVGQRRPVQGLYRLRRRRGFMFSLAYWPPRSRSSSTRWCPNCSAAGSSDGNTPGSRNATISVRIADAPAGAMSRTDHPSDATARLPSFEPTFSKPRNER